MSVFVAFALTVAIEGSIAALILSRRVWVENFAIQLATWPVANALIHGTHAFWSVEAGVVIVETFLWFVVTTTSLRRAAGLSLVANGVTAMIGWGAARLIG